jgi:hypothetical protein
MIAEGILSRDQVIRACFNYMSEDDVTDMAESNGFFEFMNDEEDDE